MRKQQLELDMEQWTDSKLGKESLKAVYCHPAYLTYMQNESREMMGWMKHKLETRLLGEISTTSDIQNIPTEMPERKEVKSVLMKVKEETEKAGFNFNIQKMKFIASGPTTS